MLENKQPLRKATLVGVVSIGAVPLVYVVTQWYVYLFPSYDLSTFVIGAVVPFAVSVLLALAAGNRILLYTFLAYFWALVDDGPVFLDSVLTWPEVTRFHPASPHVFLEVLYHLLTAAFLVLAVREAAKGAPKRAPQVVIVSFLTLSAFVLAYAQNIPLNVIQATVEDEWYQLDIFEHILSAFLLFLAITWMRGKNPSSGLSKGTSQDKRRSYDFAALSPMDEVPS